MYEPATDPPHLLRTPRPQHITISADIPDIAPMDIYVFSSKNLTNIWAGVGARKWAISKVQADMSGTLTKARRLRVGALGLLYCVETQSLTTPFLVASVPDPKVNITNIWPEEWFFPFSIRPLGSPVRQMAKNDISKLPTVTKSGRQWNTIIRTQGQFVFQPSQLEVEDWEIIFGALNDAQ